jgi:hypothetical protein
MWDWVACHANCDDDDDEVGEYKEHDKVKRVMKVEDAVVEHYDGCFGAGHTEGIKNDMGKEQFPDYCEFMVCKDLDMMSVIVFDACSMVSCCVDGEMD